MKTMDFDDVLCIPFTSCAVIPLADVYHGPIE